MTAVTLPTNTRIGLCFHGIGRRLRTLESDEFRYWVSEDQFLRILDEAAEWPQVDISFDDGNASDVAIALPALQQRGLVAVFYALAGRLDQPGSLSTAELREIVAADMEIGTHGWHHIPWSDLDDDTARLELVEARERLADAAGRSVAQAALPLGRYNRRALRRLQGCGLPVSVHERPWSGSTGGLAPTSVQRARRRHPGVDPADGDRSQPSLGSWSAVSQGRCEAASLTRAVPTSL